MIGKGGYSKADFGRVDDRLWRYRLSSVVSYLLLESSVHGFCRFKRAESKWVHDSAVPLVLLTYICSCTLGYLLYAINLYQASLTVAGWTKKDKLFEAEDHIQIASEKMQYWSYKLSDEPRDRKSSTEPWRDERSIPLWYRFHGYCRYLFANLFTIWDDKSEILIERIRAYQWWKGWRGCARVCITSKQKRSVTMLRYHHLCLDSWGIDSTELSLFFNNEFDENVP